MMDDAKAFEDLVASRLRHHAGPAVPVDDAAVYHSVAAATRSPVWSLGSMFGTTRSVVVGAIVALLGGSLIVVQYATPLSGTPGAATDDAGAFSPTGSLAEPKWGHTATLLPDGRVLIVGGEITGSDYQGTFTNTAEVWDPAAGTFSPTGSLSEPRGWHSATLLPDGRVLVVGGANGSPDNDFASAEIWDPESDTFSPAGSLAEPPGHHTATLLPDGRVLVVADDQAGAAPHLAVPEVWDPETNAFSPAGSLAEPRGGPATLLLDGRVLVVGGSAAKAEVWDPETDAFSPAGSLGTDWGYRTSTLLSDGRVLVTGSDLRDGEDASAVVWDPATSAFSPAGSPAMAWIDPATLLPDGRVLVVGYGSWDVGDPWDHIVAQVWDPESGTFSPAGSLAQERDYFSTTAVPDGRVLIVGGCIGMECQGGPVASAEIWDPENSTFIPAGSLAEVWLDPTATLLSDGRVLIAGGIGDGPTDTAEVWAPSGE
jgi:hypothetical protein